MSQPRTKIKAGDQVKVISGKARGRTSTVKQVLPEKNQVIVEDVNVVKRHVKPSQQNPRGGIIEEPRPIHISNVAIVHPDDKDKTSRIGYEFENGQKVRVYRQADNKRID